MVTERMRKYGKHCRYIYGWQNVWIKRDDGWMWQESVDEECRNGGLIGSIYRKVIIYIYSLSSFNIWISLSLYHESNQTQDFLLDLHRNRISRHQLDLLAKSYHTSLSLEGNTDRSLVWISLRVLEIHPIPRVIFGFSPGVINSNV